jgi:hypothetical protein
VTSHPVRFIISLIAFSISLVCYCISPGQLDAIAMSRRYRQAIYLTSIQVTQSWITIPNSTITTIKYASSFRADFVWKKSRQTARSWHSIEEIRSTNHIAREHFLSNQNARTRHRHGYGTTRPYRSFFTVIRNLLYKLLLHRAPLKPAILNNYLLNKYTN